MENGLIPDEKVTASSTFQRFVGSYGRLNNDRGSWFGDKHLADNYLQIDLQSPHIICAVTTQGSGGEVDCWVKSYALQSSVDNKTWTDYKENGQVKVSYKFICYLYIKSLKFEPVDNLVCTRRLDQYKRELST